MGVLNFRLDIEYDGTHFHGWQFQPDVRTVQAELENALRRITGSDDLSVIGAGRTDAGVHARHQVAHVKLETSLNPDQLRGAINSQLADDLHVRAAETAPMDFHARFDAIRRHYSYRIVMVKEVLGRHYQWYLKYGVEAGLLRTCAEQVEGTHDFSRFAHHASALESAICTVHTSTWDVSDTVMVYRITANRFLHHMVRYLVGTMVDVGRGRYSVSRFERAVNDPPGDIDVQKAPARGLVLEQVVYPTESPQAVAAGITS